MSTPDDSITINDTTNPALLARQAAAQNAANLAGEQAAAAQESQDVASGNYLGAFQAGESFNPTVTTSQNSGNKLYKSAIPTSTTNSSEYDPATGLLLNSTGLSALDPSKQWTAADDTAYYGALTDPSVYNSYQLGANPSGLWGDASHATQDAATNAAATPGAAPNVSQYQGSQPDVGFLTRWGAPIAAAAMLALAPEMAPAMAAGAGGGALGAASAGAGLGGLGAALGSTLSSNPNFGQNMLLGALGGGATGALSSGISSELPGSGFAGEQTAGGMLDGLAPTAANSTVSGGLAGAGVGAARGAITGNNVGEDALIGGGAGAATGLVGNLSGSNTAGQLTGTIVGAGLGTLLNNGSSSGAPSTAASAPSTPASSLQTLPTDPNGGTTNIGSYSGYGYAPRQQTDYSNLDFQNYGEGPEASFFTPQGSSTQPYQGAQPSTPPATPPATANTQPIPVSIPTLRQ